MITVALDRSEEAKDLYIQLYEAVREMIIDGEIPAQEKLPSKKKLASHLQVSVKTVENAYYQLMLEGYIYSKEKVGFFASNLEGFYRGDVGKRERYVSHFEEEVYTLDIKGNATPIDLFPLSVWNRLGREVMSDLGPELLETVPFNGVKELRIAIAKHLRKFQGMIVSPDQIVIGSGTEYLYRRILSLIGSDTVMGMEEPGYLHIRKIMDTQHVTVRNVPVDDAGIRVDLLEKSGCSAVHVSPMHHFPLGITMPIQRRIDLLRWVNREPERWIIEDHYNGEYLYAGNPVPTLFSEDVRGKVIHINTFSKTLAPGARVAYMVLPEVLMDRYLDDLGFYSCTVPSMIQHQLARFIEGGHLERHIHRVRQYNIAQRKLVVDTVETSSLSQRIKVRKNPAGTHFVLEIDANMKDGRLKEHLKDADILCSLVSDYCNEYAPDYQNQLILNYSRINRDGLCYLLETLDAILD